MIAVIFMYSFDKETPVYLFNSEDAAKAFLRDTYEAEVLIDQENGYDTESEISEDGFYAKITNRFADRDDVTEMRIGTVYAD